MTQTRALADVLSNGQYVPVTVLGAMTFCGQPFTYIRPDAKTGDKFADGNAARGTLCVPDTRVKA